MSSTVTLRVMVAALFREQMIAIKPICEALGIDWSSQKQRVERDEILSSTMVMITTVAADGKEKVVGLLVVSNRLIERDVREVRFLRRRLYLFGQCYLFLLGCAVG